MAGTIVLIIFTALCIIMSIWYLANKYHKNPKQATFFGTLIYIFAGWTEAMGLFGVIVYLFLLGFFSYRGYRTAMLCPKRFDAYTAFGCVTIILLQSLINCAVVCGLFPTTGIPLPFFSLGGSSIIVTLAMSGILLNASRCEEKKSI